MIPDLKPIFASKNILPSNGNMEDLHLFEQMAQVLCMNPNPKAREVAKKRLMNLEAQGKRFYKACMQAFKSTTDPTTKMFILARVSEKLTVEWNQNFAPQGMEMQQFFYDAALAHQKQHSADPIKSKLFSLIARISALSWNTNAEIQSKLVFKCISSFQKRPMMAAALLSELVHEMNLKRTTKKPNDFRKRTSSFTRTCLFSIISVATNGIISRNSEELICACLKLLNDCLSFDFLGTSWGVRTEDFFVVQIPKEWRKAISDPKLAEAHYEIVLCANAGSKAIPLALSNLVLLLHARKPQAKSENVTLLKTHSHYYEKVLQAGSEVLEDEFNHVQICRMMLGIKSNYQVVDILETPNAEKLLEAMLNFTIASFGRPDFQHNHYLLEFWARFVMAIPYLRHTKPEQMHRMIAEIAEAFLMSRLKYIELNFQHNEDMFPAQQLNSSMEDIRYLIRFNYRAGFEILMRELEPRAKAFESAHQHTDMQVKLVQWQIGWLSHVIGSCLSISRPLYQAQKKEEEMLLQNDGKLVASIFKLVAISTKRLPRANISGSVAFLEHGILRVLRNFQESHLISRGTPKKITDRQNRSIFSYETRGMFPEISSYNNRDKQLLGVIQNQLGDQNLSENALISAIVDKTYLNLRFFADEEVLISSVSLLQDICVKYRNKISCRDISERIVRCHKNNEFQFKRNVNKNFKRKIRTRIYYALYQLLMEFDDYFILMKTIYETYDFRFSNLSNSQLLGRNQTAVRELIGDIRDLTGLAQAIQKTSHYIDFLEFLLPHFPFFEAVAVEAVRTHSIDVSSPLLQFVVDLTNQKFKRIAFPPSSTKGIRLFQFVMNLIIKISEAIESTSEARIQDLYESRYKVVCNCIQLYHQALDGEFVRYGQLLIFGENCVQTALEAILGMVNLFGLENLLYFKEIEKAYWLFLRVVLAQQLPILLTSKSLEAWDFLFKSFGHCSNFCDYASGAIARVFHCLCNDQKETYHPFLEKYMEDNGEFVFTLLFKLFRTLFFEPDSDKHQRICHAVYKIICAYPPIWDHYFQRLAKCQKDPSMQMNCKGLSERLIEIGPLSRKASVNCEQNFSEAILAFRTQTINILQEPSL